LSWSVITGRLLYVHAVIFVPDFTATNVFRSATCLRGFLAVLLQAPVVHAMDLDPWTWLFP
jgi:hypothetical protein